MKNNIKLVIESLFDEFDDIYSDDDSQNELTSTITSNIRAKSIAQCLSVDEINDYLFNKWIDIDSVHDNISKIIERGRFISEDSYELIIFHKQKYSIAKLYGIVKLVDNDTILVRNVNVLSLIITDPNDRSNYVFLQHYSRYKSKTIEGLNNQLSLELNENIKTFIIKLIENVYKTPEIYKELTVSPKIYKVVLKDIDRMYKCLETNNYTGFNLITKPDKLVARLAALFICAEKEHYTNMTLTFNDDILLSIFSGEYYSYNSRSYSKRGDYILLLRKIQDFPTIHLKDIIATYNEYKNKF